jgi:hypothetical protein
VKTGEISYLEGLDLAIRRTGCELCRICAWRNNSIVDISFHWNQYLEEFALMSYLLNLWLQPAFRSSEKVAHGAHTAGMLSDNISLDAGFLHALLDERLKCRHAAGDSTSYRVV